MLLCDNCKSRNLIRDKINIYFTWFTSSFDFNSVRVILLIFGIPGIFYYVINNIRKSKLSMNRYKVLAAMPNPNDNLVYSDKPNGVFMTGVLTVLCLIGTWLNIFLRSYPSQYPPWCCLQTWISWKVPVMLCLLHLCFGMRCGRLLIFYLFVGHDG